MAKIPKSPEEIFEAFTRDYQSAFGEALLSITLFGSGAKGQYVRGKSDINFLVVLTAAGMDELHKALDLVPKWRKRNVSVPLFLTKEYIHSALDTFPIEFLNMGAAYKVVYGEDVLQGLEFSDKDLRLQLERELRGKLLHLREGFLSTGHSKRELRRMLSESVPTFASLFRALLHLKEKPIPETKDDVFGQTAELLELDHATFAKVLEVRTGTWKGSKEELQGAAMAYIRQIKKLVEIVDQM